MDNVEAGNTSCELSTYRRWRRSRKARDLRMRQLAAADYRTLLSASTNGEFTDNSLLARTSPAAAEAVSASAEHCCWPARILIIHSLLPSPLSFPYFFLSLSFVTPNLKGLDPTYVIWSSVITFFCYFTGSFRLIVSDICAFKKVSWSCGVLAMKSDM